MDARYDGTSTAEGGVGAELPKVDLFVERLHDAAAVGDRRALEGLLGALVETARRERELAAGAATTGASGRERDVRRALGIGLDDQGRGDCYDLLKGPDLLGRTALHQACYHGHLECVQLLLEFDVALRIAMFANASPSSSSSSGGGHGSTIRPAWNKRSSSGTLKRSLSRSRSGRLRSSNASLSPSSSPLPSSLPRDALTSAMPIAGTLASASASSTAAEANDPAPEVEEFDHEGEGMQRRRLIDTADLYNMLPIHVAIYRNKMACVKLLLTHEPALTLCRPQVELLSLCM